MFLKGLRLAVRRTGLFFIMLLLTVGPWQALTNPNTPLPRQWNPLEPLRVDDPLTQLTKWKLRRTLANPALCLEVLGQIAEAQPMADFIKDAQCHIKNRVKLSRVGGANLAPVETTCSTALRLALWEKHGVQPAAARHLQKPIAKIRHFSSYNCRAMRTSAGEIAQMSSHATADSIDISGFVAKGGTSIDLKRDWGGNTPKAAFLRDVNESACIWFRVSLGPRYNSLHADHFHLQGPGWGLCR